MMEKIVEQLRVDQNPNDYYELLGEIGRGSYGVVYKAKHKVTKEIRAIKQITI